MFPFPIERIDLNELAVEYKNNRNEYYFKGFVLIYGGKIETVKGLGQFPKRSYADIHTYVNKVEELKDDDK